MMKFLRSFFGISELSGNRSVVGGPVTVDARQVLYIKNSTSRISALQQLYARYKTTPYEAKIKEVYEKTKNIHAYLVYRKKLHELELFHLQNTDHFLNTFTVILDVHQKHAVPATASAPPITAVPPTPAVPPKPIEEESFFKNFKSATATIANKTRTTAEAPQPVAPPRAPANLQVPGNEIPTVTLPDIAIDTSSRIRYAIEAAAAGPATIREIGFTVTPAEKEFFLEQVAGKIGIQKKDLSYVGNAMLFLPAAQGQGNTGFAPVLHWRGAAYALHLQDYRLFPVKLYRRNMQGFTGA